MVRPVTQTPETMMLVATFIVLSMATFSLAAEDRYVCNPVINVGKSACPDGDTSDSSTETRELVKELFDDLSTNLISTVKQSIADLLEEANIGPRPRDCSDVKATESGVHMIYPDGVDGFSVYCDMETGRWTVIQRREDGGVDFYREWEDYKEGFGELDGEFWLGNDKIHSIVSGGVYELRIDMVGPDGVEYYAEYDKFAISDESGKYALAVQGYHGDAGDELKNKSNGNKFTTRDQDHDTWDKNCAVAYTGAWWYGKCHTSNLNGMYGETDYAKGIIWKSITGYYKSLSKVEMKVRPRRKA